MPHIRTWQNKYSQTCFSVHLSIKTTFFVSLENDFSLKHVLKEPVYPWVVFIDRFDFNLFSLILFCISMLPLLIKDGLILATIPLMVLFYTGSKVSQSSWVTPPTSDQRGQSSIRNFAVSMLLVYCQSGRTALEISFFYKLTLSSNFTCLNMFVKCNHYHFLFKVNAVIFALTIFKFIAQWELKEDWK